LLRCGSKTSAPAQKGLNCLHFSGRNGLENLTANLYIPFPSAPAREPMVRASISYERFMAERPNPFTFLQQVRAEAAKVVWPSRRETAVSTVMVVSMAFLAAMFFLAADQIISRVVTLLLGVGG
jgi:preprotein translocase subunit SecE